MAEHYSEDTPLSKASNGLKPRAKTIDRILVFSKAYQPKQPLDNIVFKN